jgi:hypothetical protein
MILKLIYRKNSTGESILKYFEDSWTDVDCYKFEMNGKKYLEISAERSNEKLKVVFNGIKALGNCLDQNYCEDILALNDVATDFSDSKVTNKSYDILLFNMSVISVNQFIAGKTTANQKYINEKQVPKVCELAKRVLNLLGLDYAMIKISSNAQRKLTVTGINTSPVIRGKDLVELIDRLEMTLKQYVQQQNNKLEIKLGADPEFMIANSRTKKMIPASDFFPRQGSVGCDNIRIPRRQQRPIAELRPQPDISPIILHANIKATLEQANKMAPYKNIKLLAGSQPFPGYSIGGHIHFSNICLNSHILRVLDNYLGLPVFLLEDQQTAVKRRNKYGRLNDYRIKDHGGFEYRTLGSWLVSPEISLAVLCLAKLVSSNFLQLPKNYFLSVKAHQAFYQGDAEYFREQFDELWQDIKKLDDYKKYSQELEIIPQMIKKSQIWDENADLRKTWHLNRNYSKRYTAKTSAISASNINIRSQTTTSRRTSSNSRSALRSTSNVYASASYQSSGRYAQSPHA